MKNLFLKLISNLESEAFSLGEDTHQSYIALNAVINALKNTIEEEDQTFQIDEEDNIPF